MLKLHTPISIYIYIFDLVKNMCDYRYVCISALLWVSVQKEFREVKSEKKMIGYCKLKVDFFSERKLYFLMGR